MAVGAISSAHNLGNTTPAAPILSGEKLSTTQAALKAPGSKTYYHQVPGANYFMPNGLQIQFLGGVFTTADKEIIAELDAVADKNASLITSEKARQNLLAAQDKLQAEDAAKSAAQ